MKKLNLTDKRKPDYFYSEAIKTLRTNIQLSGQSIKTILVTSCFPNEGKSDVVLSLAQELGSIGKKVLLLDADIRKTAYAGRLGVEEEVKGLTQLAEGLQGELTGLVPLADLGEKLLLCEIPGQLLDVLLLVCQFEIHGNHPFLIYKLVPPFIPNTNI